MKTCLFLLIAVATGACSPKESGNPATAKVQDAPSASVQWNAIRQASEMTAEEYPARVLSAAGALAVSVPPLHARVLELLAKPGDSVELHAPLVRVVMPEAAAAEATILAANASLSVLTRRRSQLQELERDGLVRAADLATLDLDLAKFTGEKLRAEGVLKGAGLTGGGAVLLRSPAAGIVTEMSVVLGEMRGPEDGPVARIRSRTSTRIEATSATRLASDGGYTFLSSDATTVPVKLVNCAPQNSGVGYMCWFDAMELSDLPANADGRIRVKTANDSTLQLISASSIGAQGDARFVAVRARTGGPVLRQAVELVRVVASDALVRGLNDHSVLVASDPYAALALHRSDGQP